MKAQSAKPAAPKTAAIEETGAQLQQAAPSNSKVQDELTDARADGASPEEEVPSLLSTMKDEIPHKAEMEAEFGDLSEVDAHVGGDAGAIVAGMGAEGVAVRGEVAFASDSPSPEVVRHELTHLFSDQGSESADEAHAESAESEGECAVCGECDGDECHLPGEHPVMPIDRSEPRFKLPTEEVDHQQLAQEGKGQAKPLSPDKIQSAIAYNNKKWSGPYRAQIRGALGAAPPAEGSFTEAEVQQAQAVQLGAGVPAESADGKIGDTTMAILLQSGLELDLQTSGGKVNPADVEILFYPGEFEDLDLWKEKVAEAKAARPDAPYRALSEPQGTGRMYVKHKGMLVYVANARGGPPISVKDFGGHTADPTSAGTRKLGAGHAHVTNAWSMSQIPWGAKVRRRQDGEWEFSTDKKTWKIATGPKSVLKTPLDASNFEDDNGGRDTWQMNDFGQEAFAIQGTAGQYIHTSPSDEEAVLRGEDPELSASHGCVHIDPAARAELSRLGYLAAGVTFTVKSYETHLLPEKMRNKMEGDEGEDQA